MSYKGEKVFKGLKLELKYLLQKSNMNSTHLIIIFSAFSKAGTPPTYNYVRTLSSIDCNKLFILDDYGPSGSYYLGKSRELLIEESTMSLINRICDENKIKRKNIITIGSSKGGFAALYFGIKYSFGNVITAAPQILVGNYLFNYHKEVAKYIAGGLSEDDKTYLNSLMQGILKENATSPNIYIHIGRGDHHYKEHIIPFLKSLNDKNIKYELDIKEYMSHAEVGLYFPEYMLSTIEKLIY